MLDFGIPYGIIEIWYNLFTVLDVGIPYAIIKFGTICRYCAEFRYDLPHCPINTSSVRVYIEVGIMVSTLLFIHRPPPTGAKKIPLPFQDSHMFGLSQLYQMRGRVGRSNVAAYTYLLYPPGHALSNEAKRRLKAMRELSHLGSGFELANRDLEIRGAGNIFGTDQVR